MDRIYKTINLDNSRSHINGLLPFVRYNGGNVVENVTSNGGSGNYGNYVCDFCIFTQKDEEKIEISRLKYLDILNWYDEFDAVLKNAVYTKKVVANIKEISKIDCGNNTESNANITITENKKIKLLPIDSKDITIERLYFTPIDQKYFQLVEKSYEFVETSEYIIAKGKSEEERTDEDNIIIMKTENVFDILSSDDTYYVLMNNYAELDELRNKWANWWLKYYGEGWETDVFNGYVNFAGDNFLKFCYDIETYVLGKKEVIGENIKGDRVPPYTYYTTIFDEKKWFENNSASTVNAYTKPTKDNRNIITKWEGKGGGEYYNFLNSITPIWQIQKSKTSTLTGNIFEYAPPIIEIQTFLKSEYDYDTLYSPYEYNIEKNRKVGAVKEYTSKPIDNIVYVEFAKYLGKTIYVNSYYDKETVIITTNENGTNEYEITDDSLKVNGLTKQWAEFDDGVLQCESQLSTLKHPSSLLVTDNIYGVYKLYNDDAPEMGQLFKCVYKEEYSTTPYKMTTLESLDDGDGYEVNIEEEEVPNTEAYQVIGLEILSESSSTITTEDEESTTTVASTWYQYGWWDCEKIGDFSDSGFTKDFGLNYVCSDGEDIKPYNSENPTVEKIKYQNVTILSCIDNIVVNKKSGDTYYILSRFDNGRIINSGTTKYSRPINWSGATVFALDIPYVKDYPLNIVEYDNGEISFDKIIDVDSASTSGKVIIHYAKGITSGASINSGIHYKETFNYEYGLCEKVPIDGVYVSELYYNKIIEDDNKVAVNSEEYELNREALLTNIVGMEVGTQWTNEGAVEALLISKESTDSLTDEPKYNIDMLYNRGNAAAWEYHFKLSECNTMEDLENYGNNFFNL